MIQLKFLDSLITEKPESTAKELAKKILDKYGIQLSKSRVSAWRKKLGWIQTGSRYCQLIRERNKVKRVDWANEMLRTQENFDVS